jgi:transcriptional regulator with XRE-family HTH domain
MAEESGTEEPSFGDLLQHYRRAAGLTQEALAERAGISARGISDLERGAHAAPRKDTLGLLLAALELDPRERASLSEAARRSGIARPRSGAGGNLAPEPSPAFPAARVPVALDPLIGREDNLAAVDALLRHPDVRLVTVTGPGGTGKTRLAVAAATDAHDAFPGGVAFVDLGAVSDPTLVAARIAQALEVRESGADPLAARLATAMRGRRLLLVLDNFEQVLDAAPEIRDLLERAPGLTVLATSRAPLRVAGSRSRPWSPSPPRMTTATRRLR